jgi:hypothetical protein
MLGGDREYITLDLGANGTSGNINGLNGTAVAHAFWLHEVIFSGGVKKGGVLFVCEVNFSHTGWNFNSEGARSFI